MPFRLNEFRAKVQFVVPARFPSLIYRASLATGRRSNTVYLQHAVAEALSRDLGIPLEELLAELPKPTGAAAVLRDGKRRPVPTPTRTVEDVL